MPVVRCSDRIPRAVAARASSRTAGADVRREAIALVQRERLVQPAYSYRLVRIEQRQGAVLVVGGERIVAPDMVPEAGMLSALACVVCTIGPALEARVSSLFAERRPALALALDTIGNELLLDVARKAADRVHCAADGRSLTVGAPLHPGDADLALGTQGPILRLAQADRLGIGLTSRGSMTPLKSTSLVMAVGIGLRAPVPSSRCERCRSRARCGLRPREALVHA